MISFLDGMVKLPQGKDTKFKQNLKGIKALRSYRQSYLYTLNPSCMNSLEWHERVPGNSQYPYCHY